MTRNWAKDTRILLVEDDRVAIHLYSYRLELEGLDVVQVSNGIEAMERLRQQPFSAMVTDLLMPGMSGLQLIRQIRSSGEPWCDLPILVLSASRNEQDQMDAFRAGADDFMSKPVSAAILMERLFRLIKPSRGPAGP